MSSVVRCGSSSSSSPSLAPSASLRRMSSTVIRVPRITGFPIIIAGLISIRSVVISIPFTHHSAPARVAQSHLATSSKQNRRGNTSSVPGFPPVPSRSRPPVPRGHYILLFSGSLECLPMKMLWWLQRDAHVLEEIRAYREELARQKQERRAQRREQRDYVAIGIAVVAAAFTCWQA